MRSFRSLLATLITLATLLIASPGAWGATLLETDELEIEFRGMVEAGAVWAGEFSSRQSGPRVGLARLSGRATYDDLGRVFVQYEAASGSARLLDALAVLYITDWLHLRLGYFKTPVSADYNVSTARKPFPSRSLVSELTPRRGGGGELFVEAPFAGATTSLYLGAFDPGFLSDAPDGTALLTARAEIKWPMGLGFHLGYSDHFGAADWDDSEVATVPFFIDQPRLIDVAATFETTRWFAQAEAVIAPHRAPAFLPAGIYLAAAHRFGDRRQEPTLEPIIGYDFITTDAETSFHRLRAGLNAYLLDFRIVPNLHYELTVDGEGQMGHAVLALLRMGI